MGITSWHCIILHYLNQPWKKKSIAYHAVREGVATGERLTGYESTDTNVSDLLTKNFPGGERRTHIVLGVMYYIRLDWLWIFTPWEFPTQMKIFVCLRIVQLGSTAKVVSKLSSDNINLRGLI